MKVDALRFLRKRVFNSSSNKNLNIGVIFNYMGSLFETTVETTSLITKHWLKQPNGKVPA